MTEKMMKFLEVAEKDEALVKAVQDAATLDDVLALAKTKGFDLTYGDLRPELPVGEIDDEALDDVAGGRALSAYAGSSRGGSAYAGSSRGGSAHAGSALSRSNTAGSATAASNTAASATAASVFAGSNVAGSSFAGSAVSNSAVLRSIFDKFGGNGDWMITK